MGQDHHSCPVRWTILAAPDYRRFGDDIVDLATCAPSPPGRNLATSPSHQTARRARRKAYAEAHNGNAAREANATTNAVAVMPSNRNP